MKRAAIAAALAALVLSAGSFVGTAGIPRPILPVPEAAFRPVVLAPGPEGTQTRRRDDQPVLVDPTALQSPPAVLERAEVAQPLPKVGSKVTVAVIHSEGSRSIRGPASWYCRAGRSVCHSSYPDRAGVRDMYAAAGPRLRAAICGVQSCTSWRGKTVWVNGKAVKLVDWCQCYWKRSNEKIIDLYWDAWVKTGGGTVTVGW